MDSLLQSQAKIGSWNLLLRQYERRAFSRESPFNWLVPDLLHDQAGAPASSHFFLFHLTSATVLDSMICVIMGQQKCNW